MLGSARLFTFLSSLSLACSLSLRSCCGGSLGSRFCLYLLGLSLFSCSFLFELGFSFLCQLLSLLNDLFLVAPTTEFCNYAPSLRSTRRKFDYGFRQIGNVLFRPVVILNCHLFIFLLFFDCPGCSSLRISLGQLGDVCLKQGDFARAINVLSGFDLCQFNRKSLNFLARLEQFSLISFNPEAIIITASKCFCAQFYQFCYALLVC